MFNLGHFNGPGGALVDDRVTAMAGYILDITPARLAVSCPFSSESHFTERCPTDERTEAWRCMFAIHLTRAESVQEIPDWFS